MPLAHTDPVLGQAGRRMGRGGSRGGYQRYWGVMCLCGKSAGEKRANGSIVEKRTESRMQVEDCLGRGKRANRSLGL